MMENGADGAKPPKPNLDQWVKRRFAPPELPEVYHDAFKAAMALHEMAKLFPPEEAFALPDQLRRSSRAVCAHINKAWRQLRDSGGYQKRLRKAEMRAAETQTYIQFAFSAGYLKTDDAETVHAAYQQIIFALIEMSGRPMPRPVPL